MISQEQVAMMLVICTAVGVLLLSAAAWAVSVALGLAVTGILVVVAGHWLAFLRMRGGNQ
jgi:hypothetical protein